GTLDGAAVPMVETYPITLTVEGDRVSGTAACNGYGGTLRLSGDRFSVDNLAVTEMACFPPETMESEQAFLEALIDVDTVEVADGRLVLRGETVELVFTALEPVPEAELTNTVWVLESLVQGEAVSSVAGERATLELFTDGSLIGSTGCRTLAGSYVISGSEVVVTRLSAIGDCPPELAEQDSRVISALEGGFRVEIDGDVLTTWVAGDEGLIYRAER
ncbi:MAG TPA: META domain-containing protein, partial [Acidimicrobiia bacterium]|nr:META domain-containing protein [Acidimicrobiia bacterium]